MNNTGKIAVLYLVREPESIERFLTSYEKHPAGIEHTLIFVTKGNKARPPRQFLCSEKIKYLFVNDRGFDLTAYRKACLLLCSEYTHVCCLNSHSEILADRWLQKLYETMWYDQLNLVGSTGSFESFYTNNPKVWKRLFFPEFPNPHIRTTGFLCSRVNLIKWIPSKILCKQHAYLVEAGFNSITRQAKNYKLVMKNGLSYDYTLWNKLDGYRTTSQCNLLISDNMTRKFASLSIEEQEKLSFKAWGP